MAELRRWLGLRPWQRHSLVLLVAGLAYIGIGFSMSTNELSHRQEVALVVALNWMPIQGWGYLFVCVGLLSVLSARWPPFAETWGYTLLTGLSACWASVYLVGYVLDKAPSDNITSTFVWGLVAFMWWAISGLVNPAQVPSVVVLDGRD